MSADAWALLAVSAAIIWGGLAASVVWLARHRDIPVRVGGTVLEDEPAAGAPADNPPDHPPESKEAT